MVVVKKHFPGFEISVLQIGFLPIELTEFAETSILVLSDSVYRVKSQIKRLARPMYSNPPVHGARIVANVVGDPELFNEWKEEMEVMAGRIKSVRQKLYDSLRAKDKSGKDWSFILRQIGMFSFTGLNKAQVLSFLLPYTRMWLLIVCFQE